MKSKNDSFSMKFGFSPIVRSKISALGPCFSFFDSNLAITSARYEEDILSSIGARDKAAWTSTKPLTQDSGRSIFLSTVEDTPVSIATELAKPH